MPAVARHYDRFNTGHRCTSVSQLIKPSENVFANGLGVERKGDPSMKHTDGKRCKPHTVNISGGSETVFVNGLPIARVGDKIDKGAINSGSKDVFAGG